MKKCCGTCEFNFDGICAGGDEVENKYGHKITDKENVCISYKISFKDFCELRENKVSPRP